MLFAALILRAWAKMMSEEAITPYLFVDDMMTNVSDVRRVCEIEVLHVDGGGGMGTQKPAKPMSRLRGLQM